MNKKILLIENNKYLEVFFRDLFSFFSEKNCYSITSAPSLKEAREALKKEVPDIIFIDPHTPEIASGRKTHNSAPAQKLIKEIKDKKETADVCVIAFSSHEDESLESKMLDSGAEKFLIKGDSLDRSLVEAADDCLDD